ncbi:MAG: hypothetical protein LLG04_16300, partial [Parachlamydia sp.]|nr:hypothetical protein [Parachlamydia sp.]
ECDEDPQERVKMIKTALTELELAHPNKFPPGLQVVYPLAVGLQDTAEEVQLTLVMPLMQGGGSISLEISIHCPTQLPLACRLCSNSSAPFMVCMPMAYFREISIRQMRCLQKR